MTNESQPPDPRLDAALARIQAQHGQHLPPGTEERLRTSVQALLAAADTLRATPLTNADEPDPIYRAYRADMP